MTRGAVIWLTGLPSSGKSTLAAAAHARLIECGVASCILDSDILRAILAPQAGYGQLERAAFYETLGRLAAELAAQGLLVLVPATANRRHYREKARRAAPAFLEVWVATSLDECRKRDAKGLYRRAERGELRDFPGVTSEYQPPETPDLTVTSSDSPAVEQIIELARELNLRGTNGALASKEH
ncbi:MAG TPA: adenylyl-sulfate kinase [Polyangiaceae bacterium]|jgi:adenylylsulfate kinase